MMTFLTMVKPTGYMGTQSAHESAEWLCTAVKLHHVMKQEMI